MFDLLRKYGLGNANRVASRVPNYDAAREFILDLRGNSHNYKLVHKGDHDVDGVLSLLIGYESCRVYGYTDATMDLPNEKTHGITAADVDRYISEGFTHVIIYDSSSAEVELLNRLGASGIKVMVIDHHVLNTSYSDYHENVVIVSNKLEDVECKEVSAGYLTFLLFMTFCNDVGLEVLWEHYVWGYITLIADGCRLSDDYIRPIVQDLKTVNKFVPHILSTFIGPYDSLNRQFVSYKFSNLINSCIRQGRCDLIVETFFNRYNRSTDDSLVLIEEIRDIHKSTKTQVDRFVSDVTYYGETVGDMMVFNLSHLTHMTSLSLEFLENSTGMLAARLSDAVGMPTMVLIADGARSYKGSMRRIKSTIDLYEIAKVLNLEGGGHAGAYGFTIDKTELDEMKNILSALSFSKFQSTKTENMYIDTDGLSIGQLDDLIGLVAKYNEVCGDDVPRVFLKCTMDFRFRRKQSGKLVRFELKDTVLKCFDLSLDTNSQCIIEPILDNKPSGIVRAS